MTLLRSPDGSWTGEIVSPVDVVNLKTRGYTVVEPEPEPAPEPEPVVVVVTDTVTTEDKPKSK